MRNPILARAPRRYRMAVLKRRTLSSHTDQKTRLVFTETQIFSGPCGKVSSYKMILLPCRRGILPTLTERGLRRCDVICFLDGINSQTAPSSRLMY